MTVVVNPAGYDAELVSRAVSREEYAAVLGYALPFAEAGVPEAQCMTAFLYQFGFGVPLAYERAVAWYERAAAQDYPVAWNNLGSIYLGGLGVEKDREKARQCYERAYRLGFMHIPEEFAPAD